MNEEKVGDSSFDMNYGFGDDGDDRVVIIMVFTSADEALEPSFEAWLVISENLTRFVRDLIC